MLTRGTVWVLVLCAVAGAAPAARAQEAGAVEVWVTAQAPSRLFVLSGDGTPVETLRLPAGAGPHITTFSPSGRFAYVAGMGNGDLFVIRPDTRRVVHVLDLGHGGTHQAKPSPDGSVLLVAQVSSSTLVKVAVDEAAGSWAVAGRLSLASHGKRPICTVFRPDARSAYVSLLPSGLAVVDVAAMTLVTVLPTDGFVACGMVPSQDGRTVTIAAGGGGGHIYRLDTTTDVLADAGTLGAGDWHSMNVAADGRTGFGTSPRTDELIVFELEGSRVRPLPPVALDPTPGAGNDQPDALDLAGGSVYVSLRKSGKLAIVDAARRTVRYLDLEPATTAEIPMTCSTCALHGVTIRQ